MHPTQSPSTHRNRTPIALAVGLALLAVLFLAGLAPKLKAKSELATDANEAGTEAPIVQVVSPHLASDQDLVLPGSVQAISETAVQARTSGYITKLYVDIGSRVKKGQVLADIQSPDVDQQVAQASADTAKSEATVGQSIADVARLKAGVAQSHADVERQAAAVKQAGAQFASTQSKLVQSQADEAGAEAKLLQSKQQVKVQNANMAQAQAQYDLAVATEKRYRSLLAQGFIAQQDYDQVAASLKTNAANLDAVKANISASQADVQAAEGTVRAGKALVQSARSDASAASENVHSAQASYEATLTTVDAANASVNASQESVQANRAQVGSSEANQRRYEVLRSFQQVVAPFDGVITSRNVDVGSLVNPGANEVAASTTTTPSVGLFGIARTDVLRVQLNLPQTFYQSAKTGAEADISIRELPNRIFKGKIFQTAGALDASSRTLLTEIHISNADNELLPGMYAQVRITPAKAQETLRIPANTLLFDSQGTRVAIVGSDNKIHLEPIKEGRDFGKELEVLSGLKTTDRLVTNPTDELQDGTTVQVGAK
jgi:RND family efflux transporter MFP subunit